MRHNRREKLSSGCIKKCRTEAEVEEDDGTCGASEGYPMWESLVDLWSDRAAQQYLRGEGRLYIRIFPHKPITSIPLETRMGKGKGEPDYWAAVVKPGGLLYEIGGTTEEVAKMCFARLAHKMPLRVRFIKRRSA